MYIGLSTFINYAVMFTNCFEQCLQIFPINLLIVILIILKTISATVQLTWVLNPLFNRCGKLIWWKLILKSISWEFISYYQIIVLLVNSKLLLTRDYNVRIIILMAIFIFILPTISERHVSQWMLPHLFLSCEPDYKNRFYCSLLFQSMLIYSEKIMCKYHHIATFEKYKSSIPPSVHSSIYIHNVYHQSIHPFINQSNNKNIHPLFHWCSHIG